MERKGQGRILLARFLRCSTLYSTHPRTLLFTQITAFQDPPPRLGGGGLSLRPSSLHLSHCLATQLEQPGTIEKMLPRRRCVYAGSFIPKCFYHWPGVVPIVKYVWLPLASKPSTLQLLLRAPRRSHFHGSGKEKLSRDLMSMFKSVAKLLKY